MTPIMRRVLVGLLLTLMPSAVSAQTGFTTRQIKEFDAALTAAGRFGVPRYPTASLPTCALTNRGAVAFDTSTLSLKVCDGSSWGAVGGAGTGPYDVGGATNAFARVEWNTTQTPDTGMFLTGTTSNHWVIAERQDSSFDFAHAQATDPTLFIHSHNQSTTQWLGLLHDGTNGTINVGAGSILFKIGGSTVGGASSNGIDLGTSFLVAGPAIATNDSFIGREAAATWQVGVDVNGAAVAQTIKAHDGITGTDISGAKFNLSPGLGTGKATGGSLILNRAVGTTTGTTAQTYAPAVVVCPAVRLSTTSATAQTIATITTTSTTGGVVTVDYASVACSGSTCDADGGMVKVAWNNNAGTVTSAMTAVAVQSDSDATGTLATTPTATNATNVVSIKFTPTWATIVPTSVLGYATFTVASSADTVVCTQQ